MDEVQWGNDGLMRRYNWKKRRDEVVIFVNENGKLLDIMGCKRKDLKWVMNKYL